MKRLKGCLKWNRPKDLNADASIALKENLQMQHPFIFYSNDTFRALPESGIFDIPGSAMLRNLSPSKRARGNKQ